MAIKKDIRRTHIRNALAAAAVALLVAACGRQEGTRTPAVGSEAATALNSSQTDQDKVLNIYNWSDLIDPSVVPAFEKEYGVKVNYDVFDSLDVLETKLLTGRAGYDVVGPSGAFIQRQIQAGVYQKLDKSLLLNLKDLDTNLNRIVEVNDPGNQYGVIYLWGTLGLGYNTEKIAAALPNAPVDSFAMLYNPSVIKHFKDCRVLMVDAPDQVVETVLLYLGKYPNSESLADLKAAEEVLLSIRPYVRYIDTSKDIESLANSDICLMLAWNTDVGQARTRAKEAGRTTKLEYAVPKEGAMTWFSLFAIPADVPHPKNAHLFIDYMLRPDVAAKNSGTMHSATSNVAAYPLVDPAVYNDKSVYLSDEQRTHLFPVPSHGQPYIRELNRTWTRFKTGR